MACLGTASVQPTDPVPPTYFHSGPFLKRTNRSFHPRLQCGAGPDTSHLTPHWKRLPVSASGRDTWVGSWIKICSRRVPTCATRSAKRPWMRGGTHYSEPFSARPHAAGRRGPRACGAGRAWSRPEPEDGRDGRRTVGQGHG